MNNTGFKRNVKRLTWLLAAAFFVLTGTLQTKAAQMRISVCNTDMNESNASDITGDGTFSYDAASNTLFVKKSVSHTGHCAIEISNADGLTVHFADGISLTSSYPNSGAIFVRNSSNVTFTGGKVSLTQQTNAHDQTWYSPTVFCFFCSDVTMRNCSFTATTDCYYSEYPYSAMLLVFSKVSFECVDAKLICVAKGKKGDEQAKPMTRDDNVNMLTTGDVKVSDPSKAVLKNTKPGEGCVFSDVSSYSTPNETPMTLTFVSVPEQYTVTFDLRGKTDAANPPAAQTVDKGKCAVKPVDPSFAGLTFGGWYTDIALTESYDFSTPVTKDLVLYARWLVSGQDDGKQEDGEKKEPESKEPESKEPGTGDTVSDGKPADRYTVVSSDTKAPSVAFAAAADDAAAKVVIPDTVIIDGITYKVESIAKNAFKGNTSIKSVTIGKHVKEIGNSAFEGCTSLTTVNCRSTVLARIGKKAFKGDKKLTRITLKTKKLTAKKVGKDAIKGTGKKLVIKAPAKVRKAYQTLFRAKGNKKVKLSK